MPKAKTLCLATKKAHPLRGCADCFKFVLSDIRAPRAADIIDIRKAQKVPCVIDSCLRETSKGRVIVLGMGCEKCRVVLTPSVVFVAAPALIQAANPGKCVVNRLRFRCFHVFSFFRLQGSIARRGCFNPYKFAAFQFCDERRTLFGVVENSFYLF